MSIIRTRRQTAAKNEHNLQNYFKPIPIKHDLSLFQKKSGCIEALPVQIFQMIQSYLNEREYRNLMNTNLSSFQLIRYETVHYTFKSPTKWHEINSCAQKDQEEYLQFIIANIKDKSKQISMTMSTKDYTKLLHIRNLIKGISSFSFCGNYGHMSLNFDFTIFQNIVEVSLENIHGIGVIHSGLEHVQVLKLKNLTNLKEIQGINHAKNMKLLILMGCRQLTMIPSLDNIREVMILDTNILNFISNGSHRKFHYIMNSKTIASSSLKSIEKFHSLDNLTLLCGFPIDYNCNLSNLSTIKSIHLDIYSANESVSLSNVFFPSVYHGTELFLRNLHLSQWNYSNLFFSNLEKLHLINCLEIELLPEMPCLKELKIKTCKQMKIIRSFPNLISMHLCFCPFLEKIEKQPLCKIANISDCNQIIELFGLVDCENVTVLDCIKFSNVYSLRNVKELFLAGSFPAITSFQGFQKTIYPLERSVFLFGFENLYQIDGLANCKQLHLELFNIHMITGPIDSIQELVVL
jgi:hypothetical protein